MSTRILFVDILKLFSIFLVVWGHAILHFQIDYEESLIFQIIYSFHMFLFMMLSGYFSISSMDLNLKTMLGKKFQQLLLPCISWGIICWLFITSGLVEGRFELDLKGLFTGWLGLFSNFWFLKSCFICYLLTWICMRLGRYRFFVMGVVWLLCGMQGRFFLDTMFPSFLLGVYLRKNQLVESWLTRYWYIPVTFFMLLLSFKIFFLVVVPYLLKLLIGISGALSCFLLFKIVIREISQKPQLTYLALMGKETLGIYILQAIFLEVLMPQYFSIRFLATPIVSVLMPILSLLMVILCFLIVKVINHSDFIAYIMFGRTNKR